MAEVWTAIISEAVSRAPCSDETATCRMTFSDLPWYCRYQHLDDKGHDCGVCNPAVLPTHIISAHSLMTTGREVLVARFAIWLCHVHAYEHPALSVVAGLTPSANSDPTDRDTTRAPLTVGVASSTRASDSSTSDRAALEFE